VARGADVAGLGDRDTAINAVDVMWEFFLRHRRPRDRQRVLAIGGINPLEASRWLIQSTPGSE
jgi:hypothetical protein